jgi:hypothetical protein
MMAFLKFLISLLNAMPFPVCNKKFVFRLQGIFPKRSRVSTVLCKRGGAFQRKFPVFSHLTGKSPLRDDFAAASQHSHLVAGFSPLPRRDDCCARSLELRHLSSAVLPDVA